MYKKFIKRIIDILISIIALLILSPVYLLIIIMIKIVDRCQIIYKQIRTGKKGKKFKIYKFRTITNGKNTKLRRFFAQDFIG